MKSSIKDSVNILSRASTLDTACISCQRSLQRRQYAAAAAAVAIPSSPTEQPREEDYPPTIPAFEASHPRPVYQLRASIVLSRPPVITRDLTSFEKSFYLYQRRLNERLALPFTRYFYFKKNTPADLEWKRKIKGRLTPAREIGVYHAYGKEGWNDELLVGDEISETDKQIDALIQDAQGPDAEEKLEIAMEAEGAQDNITEGGERELMKSEAIVPKGDDITRPMPRVTEADRTGDLKSLNRLLQRSLYLMVRSDAGWTFPSVILKRRAESMKQAAERVIIEAGGLNMNTWVVGNHPVGHFARDFLSPVQNAEENSLELGEKVFFMKGRIMAGQASLAGNKLGLTDFRWLSKDEIKELVHPRYWSMTANMLAER